MGVLQKLNPLKRKIMHRLTDNIGSPTSASGIKLDRKDNLKILVIRPNHRLGNLLMITPLLQEITNTFPNAKIDLFVKGGLPSLVFENYSAVQRVIQLPRRPFDKFKDYVSGWLALRKTPYDLVINVDRHSSSGTLATQFAGGRVKLYGAHQHEITEGLSQWKHMAKTPIFELRRSLADNIAVTNTPVPTINLKLSSEELSIGERKLQEILPDPSKKTICLFTYATGAKCYSAEWWEQFFKVLKSNFREYQFIEILPIENVSNLGFSIPSFYSKDVREIASVIANTSLFIGADSGIMHLACSAGVPVAGLFSSENTYRYAPYGKGMAINTTKTSIEDSVKHIKDLLKVDADAVASNF